MLILRSTLFVGSAFVLAASGLQGQVISVCEALQNLDRYNGKVISVRGFLSGAEGAFLDGFPCETHLTMKGFSWPNTVWLMSSQDRSRLHDPGFKTDQARLDQTDALVKKARVRTGDKLFLTITGLLETDEHLEQRVPVPLGVRKPIGFGPDNIAPAQLIMKTMSDLEILRCITIPLGKTRKKGKSK